MGGVAPVQRPHSIASADGLIEHLRRNGLTFNDDDRPRRVGPGVVSSASGITSRSRVAAPRISSDSTTTASARRTGSRRQTVGRRESTPQRSTTSGTAWEREQGVGASCAWTT